MGMCPYICWAVEILIDGDWKMVYVSSNWREIRKVWVETIWDPEYKVTFFRIRKFDGNPGPENEIVTSFTRDDR